MLVHNVTLSNYLTVDYISTLHELQRTGQMSLAKQKLNSNHKPVGCTLDYSKTVKSQVNAAKAASVQC